MKKDVQTVTPEGKPLQPLPEGVSLKEVTTQVDERGVVCEMFDPRWGWNTNPLVYSYLYTVRPGMIKGWGMHKKHEDRYFITYGEILVVLFDDRPQSSTKGLISKIYLSEYNRRLINIPPGIWHASQNIGHKDAAVVNFPTLPYNHKDPDKYRLPLDTDKIPYKFKNPVGW